MKKSPFLMLILMLALACQSQEKEKQNLYKQVMEIHDEIMPKSEQINLLKMELVKKGEQYQQVGNNDSLQAINKSISALEKADQAMMKWMHEFNPSYDTLPFEAATKYLKEEKVKIEYVKQEIEKALRQVKPR